MHPRPASLEQPLCFAVEPNALRRPLLVRHPARVFTVRRSTTAVRHPVPLQYVFVRPPVRVLDAARQYTARMRYTTPVCDPVLAGTLLPGDTLLEASDGGDETGRRCSETRRGSAAAARRRRLRGRSARARLPPRRLRAEPVPARTHPYHRPCCRPGRAGRRRHIHPGRPRQPDAGHPARRPGRPRRGGVAARLGHRAVRRGAGRRGGGRITGRRRGRCRPAGR